MLEHMSNIALINLKQLEMIGKNKEMASGHAKYSRKVARATYPTG
jgi:hypothetical protein